MKLHSILLLALLQLLLPTALLAADRINVDANNVALKGHDPVAFLSEKKPVKGQPSLFVLRNGALYYFSTQENRELFRKDPTKYEPAFGGFCAYGVAKGKRIDIDVNAFQWVDGRLLLQYSKGVRDDFNRDPQGNLKKADTNWPALADPKSK